MIPGMLAQGKLPACLQGTGEHPNVWFQQID
jgi:hypothetical protein